MVSLVRHTLCVLNPHSKAGVSTKKSFRFDLANLVGEGEKAELLNIDNVFYRL